MTRAEFLRIYKFEFTYERTNHQYLLATTKAIRRADNFVKSRVETNIDIYETTDWLDASQAPTSVTPWDWDKTIDQIKRFHLDYFAQRVPISEWFPLNSETEIATVYQ